MKFKANKCFYLAVAILSSTAIICPGILYSVTKAQAQSNCYMVDSSGNVNNLSGVCTPNNQAQKSVVMSSAKEFFQRGRELDVQGQSQEAIAEYTRAIEVDPNYAEAYFYRGNTLALVGQPLKGIKDLQKAAAIFESRGESEWAAAMWQHEQLFRRGIRDGEF